MYVSTEKKEAFLNPAIIQFGFQLGDNVLFVINDKLLINFSKDSMHRIQLRSTMANLLTYLLNNYERDIILDNELMTMVWEENGLRASSHRLWQVMRELRYKLREIGMMDHLIIRVANKGYALRGEVLALYNTL